jgi:hypothetical protein
MWWIATRYTTSQESHQMAYEKDSYKFSQMAFMTGPAELVRLEFGNLLWTRASRENKYSLIWSYAPRDHGGFSLTCSNENLSQD